MNIAASAVPGRPSRPHQAWYGLAVLVAAAGALAAVAVLLRVPVGGSLGERIELGRPASVHLSEAGKMVWTTAAEPADMLCEPVAEDTGQAASWYTVQMGDQGPVLNSDGRRWHGVLMVAAEPAGSYAMTCTTPATAGDVLLSVGEPPVIHDVRARALALSGAVLLALIGLVLGLVVTIRRRRAAGDVGGRPDHGVPGRTP